MRAQFTLLFKFNLYLFSFWFLLFLPFIFITNVCNSQETYTFNHNLTVCLSIEEGYYIKGVEGAEISVCSGEPLVIKITNAALEERVDCGANIRGPRPM